MASPVSKARASSSTFAKQVESYLKLTGKPKPLSLVYQSSPSWPFKSKDETQQVDVGVLDSSFNPPQLAHHALASSAKPIIKDEGSKGKEKNSFDAILLLFSVRNADKGMGSSKDASPAQRLGMMQCLAHDLEGATGANVAVGIVEEPLMIAKSTLVHEYISANHERGSMAPVRLHWLVGFDTLERFFQVKYYPSPKYFAKACEQFFNTEKTTFICARRGIDSQPNKQQEKQDDEKAAQNQEQDLLNSENVKPWLERGSIIMIDLDPKIGQTSSTAIRKLIGSESGAKEELPSKLKSMTTDTIARFIIDEQLYIEA